MERHFIKLLVHVDMPGGEAPGIDEGDNAHQKVQKALDIVLAPGLSEYDFTSEEMDMGDDGVVGLVLTHGDA